MKPDDKFEELKLLYEENATQFRFFLNWRQLLLAGYFAVVAALALALKWTLTAAPAYIFVPAFAGAGVSLLFWALDHRNRQLYNLSSEVGSILEAKLGCNAQGHYLKYALSEQSRVRHGLVLATFYLLCGALMLAVGVLSLVIDLSLKLPPGTN